ncbi:MAG: substrate-binding domain-containing protein [Lachnospiraceae bacterium]|nr:substrate-binding domain-containing protein [Lachnospiraceae bacterium]
MARNRIYFGMLIFVLVTIIVWTSYSMLNVGKKEGSHKISVIVNNSNDERWIALRQGLEQAAKDYDLDLNYVFTGEFKNLEEELEMVSREIEGGAEGIIIQMVFSGDLAREIPEFETDTKIVLIESDLAAEGIHTYVGPDNHEIGKALAEAVLEEYGETLAQKRVGILSGNQRQYAMQQRLAGLKEGLEAAAPEIVWILDKNEAQAETEGQAGICDSLDFVIALGNRETEQMADYMQIQEGIENCLLYGVGCSEKAVYYLDKGMIQTLVVPNEFNMGYQSMEIIGEQLKYHWENTKGSQIDYLVIHKGNLYDTENQKVLFPIVQ